MAKVLVTGATGLIGSSVCRLLAEDGDEPLGLVRPGSDRESLEANGIAVVEGDVISSTDVLRASEGCAGIVHSAASLGGASQDRDEHRRTNVEGTRHALDAGARHGIRVVALTTPLCFDFSTTLTEESPLAPGTPPDPYTATKAEAHMEALERAAQGQDVVEVSPGGAFGPGLSMKRSIGRTSWNRAIRAAINGRIDDYLMNNPVPWVLGEDTAWATVAALRTGRAGATYIAFGAEDASDGARFLNLACEVAGVEHRVRELWLDDTNEAHILERFGPSLVANAKRTWPVPWFDNHKTREELAYNPRPLRHAMEVTVDWLRREGHILA
jgi:nucleoside-diphosphate-sugar epimerase